VISRATPSFWRALRGLSAADQQAARRAFRQFVTDPSHNSLRFKKLAGYDNVWSVRVTLSVRAVGMREGDTITWVWIGTHSEFDIKFG
jgi:hypothetical protein